MSYLKIKRFVDEQIKLINAPITIDDEIRKLVSQSNISESQAQNALLKCNLLIKRHNRMKFNKQVLHQIVQQVVKAEQANVVQVNNALEKISKMIRPVMTDHFASSGRMKDRLRLLNELGDILPEGRYLFALRKEDDLDDVENSNPEYSNQGISNPETQEPEENERDTLVRDDEELLQSSAETELRKQYTKAAQEELKKQLGFHEDKRVELREKYDHLRVSLSQLNGNIVYKMEKLAYLEKMNQKLERVTSQSGGSARARCDSDEELQDEKVENKSGTDANQQNEDSGLRSQMTRFSVLVEKLEFALAPE